MTLKLFQPLYVIMPMVPMLLRQFRRLLQIKQIIASALHVLQFAEQLKSITVKKGSLLTYQGTSGVAKKLQKLHRKRTNNWTIVSSIHNGSEITWMGHSFKTKNTKPKQNNIFKKITSFLNLKLQIIRLPQGHWTCTPTHYNSYFCSCTYEKTYLAVHFIKEFFFFVNLLTEKLWI